MKKIELDLTPPPPLPAPPRVFLEMTNFQEPNENDYQVTVEEKDGVTVYSECCGDVMSRETAEKLRDAITEWLEFTDTTPLKAGTDVKMLWPENLAVKDWAKKGRIIRKLPEGGDYDYEVAAITGARYYFKRSELAVIK